MILNFELFDASSNIIRLSWIWYSKVVNYNDFRNIKEGRNNSHEMSFEYWKEKTIKLYLPVTVNKFQVIVVKANKSYIFI